MFATAAFVALVVWTSPANSAARMTHLVHTVAARSVGEEPRRLTRTFDRIAPAAVVASPIVERAVAAPLPVEPGRFLVSAASAARVHSSKGKLVLRDPGF
jgi:hypothetical protein